MMPFHRIVIVLFVVVYYLSVPVNAGIRTSDPRCVNVKCPTPPFDLDFVTDATTCDDENTPCPKCLSNATWQARIQELGAFVKRDVRPALLLNNWLSAELTDQVAMILLREVMNYNTKPIPGPIDGTTEINCCDDEFYVEFEKWNSGRMLNDEGHFTLSQLPVGYEGGSGLFVPHYTAAQFPLSTASNAYKYLPAYASLFPAAMSTNQSMMMVDPTLGMVAGNTVCEKETWPNTSCTDGHYVPPNCVGNYAACQELFLCDPTYDKGRFEALVKNFGLNFTMVYTGKHHTSLVQEMYRAGRHFAFYWWEPDPLVSSVKGKPINFPPHNFECESKHQAGQGDPTLSQYDCAYPFSLLLKIARRDQLAKDGDFAFFFENFRLGSGEMRLMLEQHTAAGGSKGVWNISCDWVQNNYATWSVWMRTAQLANATVTAQDQTGFIIGISLGGIFLVAFVVLVIVYRVKAAHAVRWAPTVPPFTLMFTDIENSTMLYENYGDAMTKAVELHHKIFRELMDEFHVYEVKVVGDAFLLATASLTDATMMIMEAQRRLNQAEWPSPLRYWKENEGDEGSRGFVGLRVRVGIHWCRDVSAKFDLVHQRYDYYGPDVNLTARIESAAAGGQTLMSAETLEHLKKDADYKTLLGEDVSISCATTGISLKGVADKQVLFSLVPATLWMRKFPSLEGAEELTAEDGTGSHPSGLSSRQHSMSAASSQHLDGASRTILETLRQVLDSFTGPARKSTLEGLCRKYSVALTGPEARRIKLLSKAMEVEKETRPPLITKVPPPPTTPKNSGEGDQQQLPGEVVMVPNLTQE